MDLTAEAKISDDNSVFLFEQCHDVFYYMNMVFFFYLLKLLSCHKYFRAFLQSIRKIRNLRAL